MIENEFDREREAIRLNYEKNRQEYERQEQQTLALIRKLRESGADIDSNAEKTFMAGTAAAIAQAAEIRDRELADVDKKEEASYTKLLEKYETYQQGRLRIARKYDQDIAALASNPEAQRLAREAKQKRSTTSRNNLQASSRNSKPGPTGSSLPRSKSWKAW